MLPEVTQQPGRAPPVLPEPAERPARAPPVLSGAGDYPPRASQRSNARPTPSVDAPSSRRTSPSLLDGRRLLQTPSSVMRTAPAAEVFVRARRRSRPVAAHGVRRIETAPLLAKIVTSTNAALHRTGQSPRRRLAARHLRLRLHARSKRLAYEVGPHVPTERFAVRTAGRSLLLGRDRSIAPGHVCRRDALCSSGEDDLLARPLGGAGVDERRQ